MAQFIRACHEKLDGLRILQFVKAHQKTFRGNHSEPDLMQYPVQSLNEIRDSLFEQEMECRFRQGPLLPDWLPPEG